MIILIALVYTTHQTLIYWYESFKIIDGWEDYYNSCNFNTCGGIQYFGCSNSNDVRFIIKQISLYYSRIFLDLEPHSHIILDAQVLSIDTNDGPYFRIEGQSGNQVSVISSQNQICGNTQAEYIHSISITLQHNRRSILIWMYQYYGGGLISLKLSIIKCQYECAGCIENYQKFCLQWKLHQYSFSQKLITNTDGWIFGSYSNYTYFYCANCQLLQFSDIIYSTQLPPHQDVLIRFFKYNTPTIIVNYLYGKQTIKILIRNRDDPILFLHIKTQIATEYNYIRDFEVFYSQPEIIVKNLKEGCLEQIDDKCLICQEGWILDEFLENCYLICGDGIINIVREEILKQPTLNQQQKSKN